MNNSRNRLLIWIIMVLGWWTGVYPTSARAAGLPKSLGSLPDSNGQLVPLRSVSGHQLQVICFLGCDCPLAKLYGPRLNEMSVEFSDRNVRFLGINSNPQDSLADVRKYVEALKISFPILKDHDQLALEAWNARRTPEVIVLDSSGVEIYRGRIDDQYEPGLTRSKPTRHDLRNAIEEALNEKVVSLPRTEAVGCLIARHQQAKNDAPVTYCQQINRLLHQHCVECHRPGEIGPFSLLEYDEIVGWSEMMLETIENHRMPPWHANPAHGDFLNARIMPDSDRELFRRWVADGSPYGDPAALPLAEDLDTSKVLEWQADMEIPMRAEPFEVAAEGTIDYQYFVVDPKFEEDRWVRAAEIIPSNRSVVHHGIVFVRPPDGVSLQGIGWLTAYVPGQVSPSSPAYRARFVPAGSKFVFQMHYTPNGKLERDLSVLRLSFANPSEVTEEHISLISLNQELEIPPGQSNVQVEGGSSELPRDGRLLAISPHMHLRGKSIQVKSQTGQNHHLLLDVPHYDFNWQHTYILRQPLPLESIDKLKFVATFDNSAGNPFNPDPTAFVTWGEQTWEEMAAVFYEVAIPVRGQTTAAARIPRTRPDKAADKKTDDRPEELVKQLFKDLDRDQDGKIEYEEVDQAVQLRSFRRYDLNGDRLIDFDEAVDAVTRMRQ